MMSVIPTYLIHFVQVVGATDAQHEHTVAWRVPESDLDAVLRTLRFNGVSSFKVDREPNSWEAQREVIRRAPENTVKLPHVDEL